MTITQKNMISDGRQSLIQNPVWYNALTLIERFVSLRSSSVDTTSEPYAENDDAKRRLQDWKQKLPSNHTISFADRLLADGMSEDDLLYLLSEDAEAVYLRTAKPPTWLLHLAEAFDEQFDTSRIEDGISSKDQQGTKVLLSVVKPFIGYALSRLESKISRFTGQFHTVPFNPHTVAMLFLPALLVSLNSSLKRTIALEVNIARMQGRLQGATSEDRYHSFMQQLSQKEEMLHLLATYPVLARQLIVLVDRWIACNGEFLQRLCADWDDICATFSEGERPGVLRSVEGNAGDTHRGGHSVMKLKFTSGLQLIYKPKSLATETHFQELLIWLNEHGYQPTFRTLNLLDRGSYGWCEFVVAQNCASAKELSRFYERQGGYLALLHILHATDFHGENIIAAGEHPMLVDLETLFHPNVYPGQTLNAVHRLLSHGVKRVGLLPQWSWNKPGKSEGVDISGLSHRGGQLTPSAVLIQEQSGTDTLHFVRRQVPMPDSSNLPGLGEQNVDSLSFRDDIVRGFSNMYRFLMQKRDSILREAIGKFAHDETRLVLRATRFYGRLQIESFHTDFLSDALERDALFDLLWHEVSHQPWLASAVSAERDDLWAGDIPMFLTRPDTRDIYTSSGTCIPGFLPETGMDTVKEKLAQLSEHDLLHQCQLIHLSFASVAGGKKGVSSPVIPLQKSSLASHVASERLLDAACTIGDRILELSIRSEEDVDWLSLYPLDEARQRYTTTTTDIDLYYGLSGIALFLAYLGRLTESTRYTALAEVAVNTLQKKMKHKNKHSPASIGAFSGTGGVIYLYSQLGILWQRPELLEEALSLAESLSSRINDDNHFDIIAGAAGFISCLRSLHSVLPSARVREIACQCGDHLIKHAQPLEHGVGWLRSGSVLNPSVPLTGFSHGAAGIAWSLLELGAFTGEGRFREVALAALQYERHVFSPEMQNWPDLREMPSVDASPTSGQEMKQKFSALWCHGAPGIGLGRLGSLPYLDDTIIHNEVDIALKTTLSEGFGINHSLCHGDMGNLEVLLVAAQTLNANFYQQQVDMIASNLLHDIALYGYRSGAPLAVEIPGLMTGLAGTGYELLRLFAPQYVPSVLLLQSPAYSF